MYSYFYYVLKFIFINFAPFFIQHNRKHHKRFLTDNYET